MKRTILLWTKMIAYMAADGGGSDNSDGNGDSGDDDSNSDSGGSDDNSDGGGDSEDGGHR
jgi:hypothetical protein